MRISDWSSDVCSSDLAQRLRSRGSDDPETGIGSRCSRRPDGRRSAVRDGRTGNRHRDWRRSAATAHIFPAPAPAVHAPAAGRRQARSEEHTSELQSLMRTSYAVFCLKKTNKDKGKKNKQTNKRLYT